MSEKITNNNQLDKEKLSQIQYLNKVSYHSKPFVTNAYERGHASKANKPNIRRTSAYLNRLEKLIGEPEQQTERQARNERYLWEKAVESLIIDPNDIADDYWKQQEQILRDNGQGRELSQREKDMLVQDIQQQQYDSAKAWADYLGQENAPYPNWFKLYAWDGMSRLGVFDKDKALFKKRNVSTVAPYPGLNAEALAKTYEVINDYLNGQKPDDEQIAKLVEDGSFNKIYCQLMTEQKMIVKTPERTEDVRGQWVEYDINSVAELAKAAEGTGWCISGEAVARNYLRENSDDDYDDDYYYDDYDDDYYYDDYDDDDYENDYKNDYKNDNQARFILFHLEDPDTGGLAGNASASIRLNANGQVAEISGLKTRQGENNQAVEDALVPIVEAKVKTLPGGEEFLPKLADKEYLIAMDRKFQTGQQFSKEDVEFIFEINRPINQLDSYGDGDPRIEEFRNLVLENLDFYGSLADVNKMINVLSDEQVIVHFDTLIAYGADVDNIVSHMSKRNLGKNLDILISHGADVNTLTNKMGKWVVDEHVIELLAHGADVDNIVSHMSKRNLGKNLDILISHGADVNTLTNKMEGEVKEYIVELLAHGADADAIVENIDKGYLGNEFLTLLEHGVDVNKVLSKMHDSYGDVSRNIDLLLSYGATINNIVSHMERHGFREDVSKVLELGANANIVVDRMDDDYIARNIDILIKHGAAIGNIVSKMPYQVIGRSVWIAKLLERGANVNQIVARMTEKDIDKNLNTLLDHGANVDKIISRIGDYGGILTKNLDTLLEHGADIKKAFSRMGSSGIADNITKLLNLGISIDSIVAKIEGGDIGDRLGLLLEHGVNIKVLFSKMEAHEINDKVSMLLENGIKADDIVAKVGEYYREENIITLLEHGADVNKLVSFVDMYDASKYLDTFMKYGADVNNVIARMIYSSVIYKLDTLLRYGADINQLVAMMEPRDIAKNLTLLNQYGANLNPDDYLGPAA